jgi:hypothetical protein
MKSQQKSLIQTTSVLHVNHAVHVMTVATVRPAANNHQVNLQNQLCMSVPMASH